MKKSLLLILPALLATAAVSLAAPTPSNLDLSRYEQKAVFTVQGITTPKVVRLETPEDWGDHTLLLNEDLEPIAHRWIHGYEKIASQPITAEKATSTFEGTPGNLVDGDYSTPFAFDPEKDTLKQVDLRFPEKTDVSGIVVTLDDGIIPPKTVTVRGQFKPNGGFSTLVDAMDFSPFIPFPKVSVYALQLSWKTPHFLRLREIEVTGKNETQSKNELVFFAEEGPSYTLYGKTHFGYKTYFAALSQPLETDSKTPVFPLLAESQYNPAFNNDFDGDTITDSSDLCPKDADPYNADLDKNGRGDVCEDPDQDRIMSSKDNCPFAHNLDQNDVDQDGLGDACDKVTDASTEKMKWLLNGVFALAGLVLIVLVWRSAGHAKS